MKLPKEYIIVEIIPNHSNSKIGFIVQLQALKVKDNKIVGRLDLRVNENLITNNDLLKMISYDKEMFQYKDNKDDIIKEFQDFIGKDKLLIIDNYYTIDYLKNIDNKKESIFKYLPQGPQYYDEDTVTDQPMRQIVAEIIREKALHALNEEIPHGIAVTIEKMKERKNGKITDIEATIICERDSHKGIIIGKQGSMLKKIGSNARYEIEQMLEMKVNLQLWVKVRKEWRDSDLLLKNYGYNEKQQ